MTCIHGKLVVQKCVIRLMKVYIKCTTSVNIHYKSINSHGKCQPAIVRDQGRAVHQHSHSMN